MDAAEKLERLPARIIEALRAPDWPRTPAWLADEWPGAPAWLAGPAPEDVSAMARDWDDLQARQAAAQQRRQDLAWQYHVLMRDWPV